MAGEFVMNKRKIGKLVDAFRKAIDMADFSIVPKELCRFSHLSIECPISTKTDVVTVRLWFDCTYDKNGGYWSFDIDESDYGTGTSDELKRVFVGQINNRIQEAVPTMWEFKDNYDRWKEMRSTVGAI